MIAACRFLGIAAIVVAIGWAALSGVRAVQSRMASAATSRVEPEPPRSAGRPVSAGCSASNCHGDAIPADADKRPDDTWRWAATVWSMSDRHQQAFAVLKTPRSEEIGRLFDGKKPSENARCLVCHSDPSLATRAPDPNIVQARSEGVGCRACHGDSSTWLAAHLSWGPKDDRKPKYEKVGMRWMNDLPSRAAACVGCHVGAPPEGDVIARDVDHDLIAAGHPRLNFDFATYLRMMPPHWSEKDRRTHAPLPPNFEVRAWSAGRLKEMEASLDLLSYRSEAKGTHPWPEFTEFNCYDCHHDLQGGHRATDAAGGGRGRFGWYRAGELDLLAAKEPAAAFLKAMGTPAPDKEQVHGLVPRGQELAESPARFACRAPRLDLGQRSEAPASELGPGRVDLSGSGRDRDRSPRQGKVAGRRCRVRQARRQAAPRRAAEGAAVEQPSLVRSGRRPDAPHRPLEATRQGSRPVRTGGTVVGDLPAKASAIDRRGKEKSPDVDAEFAKLEDKLRLDVPRKALLWNSPHTYDPDAARALLIDQSKQLGLRRGR